MSEMEQTNNLPEISKLKLQVFIPSVVLILGLLITCILLPEIADKIFFFAQEGFSNAFGWFYLISVAIFLIALIAIATSSYGNIKLGADDSKPEYSFASWMAMLFAAGMGIGLIYYGVGEPMQHFASPPYEEARTLAAAKEAMATSFFHWGFHAWSIYCLVGLTVAYFGFRYNLPLTMRSALYPILKDRIDGWLGHSVDIFALCCTVFGLVATLGHGVLQISAGLMKITGFNMMEPSVYITIIITVIGMSGLSAISGVGKGVRRLSEANLILAILLMIFVIATGPAQHLLGAFSENLGHYLSSLTKFTFDTHIYNPIKNADWFRDWTLLYWTWWIAWAPFVGMFIARISKGRTIREFVFGALIIPALFNFIWMTVFGNTAIWLDLHDAQGALSQNVNNLNILLFDFFEYLPLSTFTSCLTIALIAIFFVTSADSGVLVVDSISAGGALEAPKWRLLFWLAIIGVTVSILLMTGGLKAIQSIVLLCSLPFTIIMLLFCFSLWKGLLADSLYFSKDSTITTLFWSGDDWKKRLDQILHRPTKVNIRNFINKTALSALKSISNELKKQDINVEVITNDDDDYYIYLIAKQDNLRDFIYGVKSVKLLTKALSLRDETTAEEKRNYNYEAVTFFEDGRKGYDIQYLNQDEIIKDILKHFERYLDSLHNQHVDLLNNAPGHTGPS
jgi:choline/glycine/proline betaine transport protein